MFNDDCDKITTTNFRFANITTTNIKLIKNFLKINVLMISIKSITNFTKKNFIREIKILIRSNKYIVIFRVRNSLYFRVSNFFFKRYIEIRVHVNVLNIQRFERKIIC